MKITDKKLKVYTVNAREQLERSKKLQAAPIMHGVIIRRYRLPFPSGDCECLYQSESAGNGERNKTCHTMTFLELINDSTLIGLGLLTIETPFASRSLFGLFWQKEERQVWVDLLFVNFKISIS